MRRNDAKNACFSKWFYLVWASKMPAPVFYTGQNGDTGLIRSRGPRGSIYPAWILLFLFCLFYSGLFSWLYFLFLKIVSFYWRKKSTGHASYTVHLSFLSKKKAIETKTKNKTQHKTNPRKSLTQVSLCSGESAGVRVLLLFLPEISSIWVDKVDPSFPAFIKYVCLESQRTC